jgi:acylphosphatase
MVEAAQTDRTAVFLKIFGRVQGVWFRGWTVDQAEELGLDGWVRNVSDGSVEALVAGAPSSVSEMIARCRKGPSTASVDKVDVKDADDPGVVGFRQEATR